MKARRTLAAGWIVGTTIILGCADQRTFHEAVRQGDIRRVEDLLDRRPALVNSTNDFLTTPLHIAAAAGDKVMSELLVAHGADIHARTRDGWTPLHSAAWRGHYEIARFLLAQGAQVNATSRDGDTPLHQAAGLGHKEVVELLLNLGANVQAKNNLGGTPLHNAAGDCNPLITKILLDRGADPNAKDNHRRTPLHAVAASKCASVLKVLVTGIAADEAEVRLNQLGVVKLLLERGANPNLRDVMGLTAASLAKLNDLDPIEQALRRKMDASEDRPSPRSRSRLAK